MISREIWEVLWVLWVLWVLLISCTFDGYFGGSFDNKKRQADISEKGGLNGARAHTTIRRQGTERVSL